jgi:chromosome segregation ATPase
MKKISQLNCELSNARSNIDQKIDVLHDHINCINDLNKKEMIELNYKNLNEINIIQSQKDTLIKHLKAVMNDQEETIQKLLKKKQNLEKEISDNKYLIEKYTKEKENYIKEKENNEILYNEKKNMMIQRHESEIGKIKNDYDNELQRLLNKYGQTKNEYINEIKKGNEIVDDFKSKAQQQVDILSSELEKLQNENDIKNKEQEEYIDKNKKLKKSLDDFNGKYDEMNMKYKSNKDEREKMRRSFHDFRKELQIRSKENKKLHDLKYGRFKFHNN